MRFITTHKHSDLDALASVVAATLLFPDAVPVMPKPVNPNVKEFLALHKDLFRVRTWKEVDSRRASALVVVDAAAWDRIGVPATVRERSDLEVVVFDHHPGTGDIDATWAVQEAVGANITLMMRHLLQNQVRLSPVHATLFLAGLYEDTGNLSFNGTTPEDARTAAYLLENKADLNIVGHLLRPAYGQKQKNVLFRMLEKAQRRRIAGHTIGMAEVEIEGFVDNLAVVVHMCREILNVDAMFGLFSTEKRDNCIVIARSNTDSINVGAMMRSMGGGGHPGAGSALIKTKSAEAIADLIRELLSGNQRSSIQVSDLMSFPVLTIPDHAAMNDAACLLREKGCTGVPVVNREGHLVGVVSRRDFQRKIKKEEQLRAPVKAFMSTAVVTIPPGKSPADASGLMIRHDIGRLPVVQDGRILGIITRSDIMRYWYDLMPD